MKANKYLNVTSFADESKIYRALVDLVSVSGTTETYGVCDVIVPDRIGSAKEHRLLLLDSTRSHSAEGNYKLAEFDLQETATNTLYRLVTELLKEIVVTNYTIKLD